MDVPQSDEQKSVSTKFVVIMFAMWLAPISILLVCLVLGRPPPGPNARKRTRVVKSSKESRDRTQNDGAKHTTLEPLLDDY